MKYTKYIIIFLILSIPLYFIIINLVDITDFQFQNETGDKDKPSYGTEIKLDVGESIGVSIVRNRWYGIIYEDGNTKTLYLFKLIRTPLDVKGINYLISHIIFISIWVLTLIITLVFEFALRDEKDKVYIQGEFN